MLRLVEGFGDFPGENRVYSADNNQEDRVGECDHVGGVYVRGADQEVVLAGWVVMDRPCW